MVHDHRLVERCDHSAVAEPLAELGAVRGTTQAETLARGHFAGREILVGRFQQTTHLTARRHVLCQRVPALPCLAIDVDADIARSYPVSVENEGHFRVRPKGRAILPPMLARSAPYA